MFHHKLKHLEVHQKYSAAHCIFNSLLSLSCGDETLRLMLDILLEVTNTTICIQFRDRIVEGDRGAGARENRGREGYGRREKKGREAGSL